MAGGVRDPAAIKELRVGQRTARPMVVAGDVNSWDVLRARKDERITVLHMVGAGDAVTRVVLVPHEGNLGCAFGTVEARDAKWITARRARRASPVSASRTEVVGDVSFWHARRGLRGARCFARRMVEANGAHLKGAPRVLRVARLFARAMVGGNDARLKAGEFVQRVCMVGPFSV